MYSRIFEKEAFNIRKEVLLENIKCNQMEENDEKIEISLMTKLLLNHEKID